MARNQINITLGTAGHIDHGKTAFIKCLTGCETDRLKEEKERGMSIELGYAPCRLGDLEVGIVDVPGHEHFIRTMVAGAAGMDACMLVVAADDGPMPQTREHLDILTLLDVKHGIVVLTKIDRVSPEEAQVAQQILADFLKGTFLEHAPIIPVSNVTGEGLGEAYEALRNLIGSIQPKPVDGVFRLPVERAFSIRGHGTVIAGVPLSGSARVDDEIVLLPEGYTGRIKGIQAYGQESQTVKAGQCAAINIRHWDYKSIERGCTLTVPGYFEPHTWCTARLQLLARDKIFLKHGATVRFHTGTSERLARVYMLEGAGLAGGQSAFVQFRFEQPVVAGPRDRFIVRELSPPQTIGGGVILETSNKRQNRNAPGLAEAIERRWAALTDDRTFVAFCAASYDGLLLDRESIARQAKVPFERTAAILDDLVAEGTLVRAPENTYLHRATVDRLGHELLDRVAAYHHESPESPGLSLDDLRQNWAVPAPAMQCVIAGLAAAGRITVADQRLSLAGHRPTIAGSDADLLKRVEALFQSRLFNPPEPPEIAAALSLQPPAVQRLLKILLEHKVLVRIDRNLVFHGDAIRQARERIVTHIRANGRLESVDFKYLVDTSRKYAIPLLDYFDRIGVTRRASDNTRYLRNPEAG
ncbi:MAG TPA: selenocysteine-specific translation elongation factor [Phycisphaerae bacterium]|nr:selenocysteine-specific translation elongation factor [Phycisphaerae bacterium]HOJ73643.1 selenocysteine-specific translation elongation factor [Phycisphaerae bacterium]HOM50290.1 selenocysteine-specific translation elongation factor [Phycisphaerae bacterium]HOQ84868.1 selenocysteine-specific translation elongation factor [Phycisphaerae bacterium]HPP27595.1 selenocysteine-specific translation elongation factor [Phycisphaerae bacterium]